MNVRKMAEEQPSPKRSLNFGVTLISIFIVLIVITAGLIGYVSFHNGQEAAQKLAIENQDSIQMRVTHDLDDFLTKPHSLNQINARSIESGIIDPHDLAGLRTRFLHQIQAFDSVMTCAFGSETGEFTSAGRRDDGGFDTAIADKSVDNDYRVYRLDARGDPAELINEVHDYAPQKRSWYRAALEANGPAWSPIYVWASQTNIGISAVRPVYLPEGKLAGVQLSALSLDYIGEFLQNIGRANNELIYIVEQNGLLVASSGSEPILREMQNGADGEIERVSAVDSAVPLIRDTMNYLTRQFTSIDQISDTQRLEFKVDGQRYFLSATPYSGDYGLDWLIVIAIPESNLTGPIASNVRDTLLVGVLILAGALILGVLITQRITHPLQQLNLAAQEMSRGKWEKIEYQSRFKEIRQLTASFNHMARQLRETFETLEQRVQERTSELTSVNEQLKIEIAERQKTEADRERLITELQDALDKVKMLSGLLPICAHCKKIRDDDGNWSDVAVYVRDHSEADFSHGICPECMAKYYSEYSGRKR